MATCIKHENIEIIMNLSNSDIRDKIDIDHNLQMRQTSTSSPITSNPPQSSSPSCFTLLVIDDNSNSEDSTANKTNDIPSTTMALTNIQTTQIQISRTLSSSTVHTINDTAEQQRRRNSSIAKLLGGQPLNNQQYEEINQQILDAQSAHSLAHLSDHAIDSGIQRTRSSITRNLLTKTDRSNSMTETPAKVPIASKSSFSKGFEYLIRREPDKCDTEHAPSAIPRNNSIPKTTHHSNSTSTTNGQIPSHAKSKRKRSISKTFSVTKNKSTTSSAPFSLHDPFELESTTTTTASVPSGHHQNNEFLHFNASKRPRHVSQQLHNLSNNHSTSNQFSYSFDKSNKSSNIYNQFSIYQDRIHSNNSDPYTHSVKLIVPTPLTALSTSTAERYNNNNNNNTSVTSIRKTKTMFSQPNTYDFPRQQSYYDTSDMLDPLLAAASEPNAPLKKRLLHAYNNEQHPT